MPEPAAPAPVGFRVATPGNWFDLDLDPATRNEAIARLVDDRIGRAPEIAPRRQEMLRILRRAAREAADRGMTLASMMVEAEGGQPISASLDVGIVALTSVTGDETPASDAGLIRDALAAQSGGRSREVGLVDLPVGQAVRVAQLSETPIPDSPHRLVTSIVQYFVPVPSRSALVVLTFATPVLGMADTLTTLFDAIATSFEFEWEPRSSSPSPAGDASDLRSR